MAVTAKAPDLSVDLGFLALRNPVLTASGTFGYGLEFEPYLDLARLGGIVVKGLYFGPREGNPPPRLAESPSGLINAIGLQGVGVEAFAIDSASFTTTGLRTRSSLRWSSTPPPAPYSQPVRVQTSVVELQL